MKPKTKALDVHNNNNILFRFSLIKILYAFSYSCAKYKSPNIVQIVIF